jgi:hypothetical protein
VVLRVVFIPPYPLFVCVLLPLAMRQAPNTNPHRPTTPKLARWRPLRLGLLVSFSPDGAAEAAHPFHI